MTLLKRQIKGYLKALSQSFFLDDAAFGAGFLILFLLFEPRLFVAGASASLVGQFYSSRYSAPRSLKDSGLLVVNGFFYGIALAYLFEDSVPYYAALVLGAFGMPLLTKAAFEVLQHWRLSPFITPYILAVWISWLCGKSTGLAIHADAWPAQMAQLPSLHPDWDLSLRLLWAVFESMGRLLFLPDPFFGFLVLVLVLGFSPRRGVFFLAGTVVGTATAFILANGAASWEYGFISYSSGLVGLGLASFPEKFAARTILLLSALSALLTVAADQFLRGMSLPVLSLPYVLTLWLALLSRVPRTSLSWAKEKPLSGRALTRLQPIAEPAAGESPEKAA